MNIFRSAIHRIWAIATMPDYVMGLAPIPATAHVTPVKPSTSIARSKAVNSSGH